MTVFQISVIALISDSEENSERINVTAGLPFRITETGAESAEPCPSVGVFPVLQAKQEKTIRRTANANKSADTLFLIISSVSCRFVPSEAPC